MCWENIVVHLSLYGLYIKFAPLFLNMSLTCQSSCAYNFLYGIICGCYAGGLSVLMLKIGVRKIYHHKSCVRKLIIRIFELHFEPQNVGWGNQKQTIKNTYYRCRVSSKIWQIKEFCLLTVYLQFHSLANRRRNSIGYDAQVGTHFGTCHLRQPQQFSFHIKRCKRSIHSCVLSKKVFRIQLGKNIDEHVIYVVSRGNVEIRGSKGSLYKNIPLYLYACRAVQFGRWFRDHLRVAMWFLALDSLELCTLA